MENLKNEKLKIKEVELKPTWSKLKSFHEKAYVGTKENGDKYLKSFGFLVCEIIKGEVKIHNEVEKWDSKSTIRHINNFLYENGLETGNKNELVELYIKKTKKIEKLEKEKKTEKAIIETKSKNKKIENVETEKETKEENKTITTEKSKNKKFENPKTKNDKVLVKAGA